MNIYGRGQGQSLGQGTFTFDKIVPNRYLLDRWANEDRVLPGRYSLIEYTLPLTISETSGQIYEKKSYDVFPKIEEKKEDNIVVGFQFDSNDADENGFLGLKEYIYICQNDNEHAGHYKYFRAEIPGPSISGTEPTSTNEGTPLEFIEIGSYDPYDFNRFIDYAYANYNINDNIASDRFALWDSTAWLKVIENSNGKSNFRYINVADLNVITPTFEVLSSNDNRVPAPITTFDWSDKGTATTATTANFNVPKIKEDKDGVFLIRYPNPMDINIKINTAETTGADTAIYNYTKNSKDYILKFPSLRVAINNAASATTSANNAANAATAAVNNIKSFISIENWPDSGNKPSYTAANAEQIPTTAGSVWQAIKDAYAAANAANLAREELSGDIITSIGENGITISIGGATTLTNGVLNIETAIDPGRIIKAADINTLWGN